jgi:outer membrane protein OmpA-like peptidoglycan-associated protein
LSTANEDIRLKKLFGSEGTMGLFVALYLILLAFFILLNAVSEHAASKAADAMESVNVTFDPSDPRNKPTIVPSAVDTASQDSVLSRVSQTFLAELEISGRFSSNGGNTFEARFPTDRIFEPGSFQIRRDMTPFLDQLVAAVRAAPTSKPQRVALLFGAGVELVSREVTRSQEIAIRRAGAIARYLTEQGLSNSEFSVGFTAISDDEILALFWSTSTNTRGGVNG